MNCSARVFIFSLYAASIGTSAAAEDITLERALALAQRPSPERLNVSTAKARVRLLESMAKRRFELRPQFGFLTLTQPLVTAASIGSGLLVNSGWSPSRGTLLDARADLLNAELAYGRTQVYKQLQTSRAFAELLQAQRTQNENCEEWRMAQRRRDVIDALLASGNLTLVDQLRYEQEILDRQSECIDSERQRKLAVVALSSLVGAGDTDLRAVPPKPEINLRLQVAYFPEPLESALIESAEPQRIRRELQSMRRAPARGGLRLPDFSVFQSNIKQTSDAPGDFSKDYLSGANFLHPALSWKISLRNTGERAAEAEMLKAKLDKLDAELDSLDQSVRGELRILQALEQARSERIPLAEKKLELASRAKTMIGLRFDEGLAGITDLIAAEQLERRMRTELARLRYEQIAAQYTLVVLTGNAAPQASEPEQLISTGPKREGSQ